MWCFDYHYYFFVVILSVLFLGLLLSMRAYACALGIRTTYKKRTIITFENCQCHGKGKPSSKTTKRNKKWEMHNKRYKRKDLKLIMNKKHSHSHTHHEWKRERKSRPSYAEKWKNTRRSSSITTNEYFYSFKIQKNLKENETSRPTYSMVSTWVDSFFSSPSSSSSSFSRLSYWRVKFQSSYKIDFDFYSHLPFSPVLSFTGPFPCLLIFGLCIPNAMNHIYLFISLNRNCVTVTK